MDRAIQYCANDSQSVFNKNGILISMIQNSSLNENSVVERLMGILKQEFMIDKYNQHLDIMKQIVKEAISIYKT